MPYTTRPTSWAVISSPVPVRPASRSLPTPTKTSRDEIPSFITISSTLMLNRSEKFMLVSSARLTFPSPSGSFMTNSTPPVREIAASSIAASRKPKSSPKSISITLKVASAWILVNSKKTASSIATPPSKTLFISKIIAVSTVKLPFTCTVAEAVAFNPSEANAEPKSKSFSNSGLTSNNMSIRNSGLPSFQSNDAPNPEPCILRLVSSIIVCNIPLRVGYPPLSST